MDIYDVLNQYAKLKTEQATDGTVYDYSKAKLKEQYTANVRKWQSYYNGTVSGIHTDKGFNGRRTFDINRASMKLPKIIATKWATTLFSEQFKATLRTDTETDKFNELEKLTKFRAKLIQAAIWGYAEGTAAIVAGAELNKGKVKLDIIKYDNIYPVVFTEDEIQVVAFAKKDIVKGESIYTISIHTDLENEYLVENLQAKVVKQGKKESIEFSAMDTVITAKTYKNRQYCIIKPNTANDYTEILPFGQSIFADALASCDDVDLAAAGLRRDVKEGDQVTFIGQDLLLEEVAGDSKKRYFENSAGRFFSIPQEKADNEKQLYDKVVPEIRAQEFRQVIQDSMDWATMSSGLGKGVLDVQARATATEVVHSEADKMQSKSLHEQYLEVEITKLIKAMCELSGMGGTKIDASEVSIVWADSVIVDTDTEKKLVMQEVDAGLKSKAEYRVQFYGETLEEAQAKIAEIDEGSNDTFRLKGLERYDNNFMNQNEGEAI